jgi:hypothetical protein
MRISKLRSTCPDGNTCPTIYKTDRGTRLVQGWKVTDPSILSQLGVPPGEEVVEVPAELFGEEGEEPGCST